MATRVEAQGEAIARLIAQIRQLEREYGQMEAERAALQQRVTRVEQLEERVKQVEQLEADNWWLTTERMHLIKELEALKLERSEAASGAGARDRLPDDGGARAVMHRLRAQVEQRAGARIGRQSLWIHSADDGQWLIAALPAWSIPVLVTIASILIAATLAIVLALVLAGTLQVVGLVSGIVSWELVGMAATLSMIVALGTTAALQVWQRHEDGATSRA